MAAPTPATRPTGITILAVLAAIGGVLGLLGSLFITVLGSVAAAAGYGGFYTIVGFGYLIVSIVYIVFAYGAWTLRPWAWTLGIGASIASIIIQILWWTQGAGIANALVSIIISLVILYYLDTPAVRAAFGKPATSWFSSMTARK